MRILFLQAHRQTDPLFCCFRVRKQTRIFSSTAALPFTPSSNFEGRQHRYILGKATELRINLNIDGAPIASRSHTHPSHSQTFRLLSSSLSLGIPKESARVPSSARFHLQHNVNATTRFHFLQNATVKNIIDCKTRMRYAISKSILASFSLLLTTNIIDCKSRFLKHVQKSRIRFYLQNATRYLMPPACAKRESRTSR